MVLLVITLIFMVVAVAFIAELMVSNGVRAGKYVNPNVATQVVRGTIFDRNGRALALEVPRYNVYAEMTEENLEAASQILAIHTHKTPGEMLSILSSTIGERKVVAPDIDASEIGDLRNELLKAEIPNDEITVLKEYEREYPSAYLASQLIDETEKVFDSVLSPAPGFNESTTYGSDVYLSIDLDIQFVLDLAVQQVFEVHNPEYCVAFIADVLTGEVLACTTYPFYDLNDISGISEQQRIGRALVSSVRSADISIKELKPVSKVTVHDTDTPVEDYQTDREYTRDLDIVKTLLKFPDGKTSILEKIPEEDSKYLVFIGSVNPKTNKDSSVLELAMESIRQGLSAQSKL